MNPFTTLWRPGDEFFASFWRAQQQLSGPPLETIKLRLEEIQLHNSDIRDRLRRWEDRMAELQTRIDRDQEMLDDGPYRVLAEAHGA